ncbi:unnamed protein product [Schistocephalus solidus]|uniref:Protein FAM136A n=1 Tax=Schistocephalus solidus TaxID=70667 RepID=A0A3P7CUA9_SCHSO|nr:unnamed protein product [Schistocephalus solidus]
MVLQNQYSNAINKSLSDLDVRFLRKMQSLYFGCGKKCCDNTSWTTEEVQSCVEKCEKPVSAAQKLIQSELTTLQERLQTCLRECSHRAYDKMRSDDISDAQRMVLQKEGLACTKQCIDDQINTSLPLVIGRVADQLKVLHKSQQDFL